MPNRGVKVFPSDGDRQSYEQSAADRAVEQLISQQAGLSSGDEDQIHVRSAIVTEDLEENENHGVDPVASVDSPVWEIDTGADEEDDWFGWYALDSNEGMDDKAYVLWGFQNLDPEEAEDLGIAGVRIRNNTGGKIVEYDLQSLDLAEDKTVLIDQPLIGQGSVRSLEVYVEEGNADSTIPFKPLITVAEEAGDTFEPSGSFADTI